MKRKVDGERKVDEAQAIKRGKVEALHRRFSVPSPIECNSTLDPETFVKGFAPDDVVLIGSDLSKRAESPATPVQGTEGRLNSNDAFVVLLQREGRIGPLATFDTGFLVIDDAAIVAEGSMA